MMNSVLRLALVVVLSLAASQPAQADDYAQRGLELLMKGSYSQAVSALTAAVRQNPSDMEVRRNLCGAYIGAGMAREAIQQLQVIGKVVPSNANDFNMQAEAYNQLGDSRTAIVKYRQALSQDPSNGVARIGLAKTLLFTGDYQQAKAACNDTLRVTRDPSVRKQVMDVLSAVKDREKVHQYEKA